jgi:hypothetical protein
MKTLTHFIYSSLANSTKCSKGKYTHIYHNDVKAKVTDAIQGRFPELFVRLSTVHLGHYVTNWYTFPPARPKKQTDGSFVIERPFDPDFELEFVWTHKDTGPFVKAAIELPPGKHISAHSEKLTWPQFAEAWGTTLGVKAKYRQVSMEDHFEGVPRDLREELEETFHFVGDFGLTGGDPQIQTAEEVRTTVLLDHSLTI